MTTVSLPTNSITRAQYDAIQGEAMHRTYSLLSQSCPGCGGLLKPTGFADWVKGHGLVVSLWDCVAAPTTCEVSRLATTFRLETQVIEEPVSRHFHNVDCGEDRSECQAPAPPTVLFRELAIGQTFDFVDDSRPGDNSFFHRCHKLSARTYGWHVTDWETPGNPLKVITSRVGTINVRVFHVEGAERIAANRAAFDAMQKGAR